MYIWTELVNAIVDHPKLKIEYGGCHSPHNETPLYGRNAYWRLSIDDPNSHFFAKVTAPVKSLNPTKSTLDKLLRAAIKERIMAITEVVECDHYGQVYIAQRDPYSIRGILTLIDGEYVHLLKRKAG